MLVPGLSAVTGRQPSVCLPSHLSPAVGAKRAPLSPATDTSRGGGSPCLTTGWPSADEEPVRWQEPDWKQEDGGDSACLRRGGCVPRCNRNTTVYLGMLS